MSIDMNLVRQAIIENKIHVFKNAFPILPSWDTLLPIISDFVDDDLKVFPDRSYLSTGNLEQEYLDHRLKCRFWSRLAFHLYDPKDPYLSVIPELSPVNAWGLSEYPSEIFTGNFCLISLMKNRGVVASKHRDEVDQFQWIVKGEAIWRTGENLENVNHVVEGDFIFLPKNLPHEVETLKAPRASINLVLRN